MATSRKKKKHISGLFDGRDVWVSDQAGIEQVILSYFYEFLMVLESLPGMEMVVDNVRNNIRTNDNRMLMEAFDLVEFKTAVLHMHKNKSPSTN